MDSLCKIIDEEKKIINKKIHLLEGCRYRIFSKKRVVHL